VSLLAELDRSRPGGGRPRSSLLLVDLDRFESVNDAHGHRGGDTVLCQVATHLREAAPDGAFLARTGVDEFAVLVDVAGRADLVQLARTIQAAVARPIEVGDETVQVTASVGVVAPSTPGRRGRALADAGLAVREARAEGPGQVRVFDDTMRQWVEQRLYLERALRRAVDRDELGVHVQPIIDLRTGTVTGAELLCRWTTDDGLEIPPTRFIALAEDSALVVDIGRLMLDRAGRLLHDWAADPRLSVLELSVNISGRHIDDHGVVDDVTSIIRRWDVPPAQLKVELTETKNLSDIHDAAATLRSLRAIGVGTTVDDFGMGHASLRYLRELPVERVKIDRSIVAGFDLVETDTVIVGMLARLAEVLDLDVVAEGIETEVQCELLRSAGCRYAQGHLFGSAMPVPEFRTWLASWDRRRRAVAAVVSTP
jgi:diguanylate cyclase (GGDEF)-like protein